MIVTVRRSLMERTLRTILLVTALLAALSACGRKDQEVATGFDQISGAIRESVDDAVADSDQAAGARETGDRLAALIDEYSGEIWKYRTRLFYLNANYQTTEADYEQYLQEISELHENSQRAFIDLATELEASMTDAQWDRFRSGIATRIGDPDPATKEARP